MGQVLDYETKSSYALTVRVTDAGSLYDEATVSVTVTNVNEPPVMSNVAFNIAANVPEGTKVGSPLQHGDPDNEVYPIQFSIASANSSENVFSINSMTGQIYVSNRSAELISGGHTYYPVVEARDAAGLYGNATVAITVLQGQTAPVFPAQGSLRFTAQEGANPGTTVGTITVTDNEGGAHVFSIVDVFPDVMRGKFVIESSSSTGTIKVAPGAVIDREAPSGAPAVKLQVAALDNSGLQTLSLVDVTIQNVNEQPIIPTTASRSLLEESAAGTEVGAPVSANDPDGDVLQYSITSAQTAFEVNPNTGPLHVRQGATIDYETRQSYTLVVRASDGALFDDCTVTIHVVDVNESPYLETVSIRRLLFGTSGYKEQQQQRRLTSSLTISIPENQPAGTEVQRILGNDPDFGDTLIYSIVGGNSDGRFDIHSLTGVVTLNMPLDYEETTRYDMNLKVSDTKTPPLSTFVQLVVNVQNVFDMQIDSIAGATEHDTAGGEWITFHGINLGPRTWTGNAPGVSATYSSDDNLFQFTSPECRIETPYEAVMCKTAPGAGTDLKWTLTIGSESLKSNITTRYSRPQITSVTTRDVGVSISALDTRGGQTVVISGSNFGPRSEETAGDGVDLRVFYGTDPAVSEFEAAGCLISVNHTEITCRTVAGVGNRMRWRVVKTGQSSDISDTDTATYTAPRASYAPPTITGIYTAASAPANPTIVDITSDVNVISSSTASGWSAQPSVLTDGNMSTSTATMGSTAGWSGDRSTDQYVQFEYRQKQYVTSVIVNDECYEGDRANRKAHGAVVRVDGRTCGAPIAAGTSCGPVQISCNLAGTAVRIELKDSNRRLGPIFEVQIYGEALPSTLTSSERLRTEGKQTVYLSGTNFPPIGYSGAVTATYSRPGSAISYQAANCSSGYNLGNVSGFTHSSQTYPMIKCTTVAGYGVGHAWSVAFGGISSATSTTTTSYRAPTVSAIYGAGISGGSTIGQQGVYIEGTSLYGSPVVVSYSRNGHTYTAMNCYVAVAHSRVNCLTSPGTGANHTWRLSIAGQTTPDIDLQTSYGQPVLFSVAVGATEGLNTLGDEDVTLVGSNFGRTVDPGANSIIVRYGTANNFEYLARDCRLVVNQTTIQCKTTKGVGANMKWKVYVDGQWSVSPTTSFRVPVIDNVTLADGTRIAPTQGGVVVVIRGSSFGPMNRTYDDLVVTHGPSGYENTITRECNVTSENPSELRCLIDAGTGTGHRWIVSRAGQASDPSTATIDYATPTLTGISAVDQNLATSSSSSTSTLLSGVSTGSDGWIQLLGANFGPGGSAVVEFDGERLDTINHVSHEQILFKIPDSQVGLSKPVIVTSGGWRTRPAHVSFAAPRISTVYSAPNGIAGNELTIILIGRGFGASAATGTVYVASSVCTPNTWSHNQIECRTTQREGSLKVRVGGQDSNVVSRFSWEGVLSLNPRVESISVNNGTTAGGTLIEITGTSLKHNETSVLFGQDRYGNITSITDTRIVVRSPENTAPGPVNLRVIVDGGMGSNAETFTYNSAVIASNTAPARAGVTFSLTLTGSSLGMQYDAATREGGKVTIDGNPCETISWTHERVVCEVRGDTATGGIVDVLITYEENSQTSNTIQFSYAVPTISGISPLVAGTAQTDPPTVMTIAGTNLGSGGATVLIGGQFHCPVRFHSSTEIRCNVPEGQGTDLDINLVYRGQLVNTSSDLKFSYHPPTLTALTKVAANASDAFGTDGGLPVIIAGNNLAAAGSLYFGSFLATSFVESWSHTEIRARTPPGVGKNIGVRVSTASGSATLPFSYEPPTVTKVSPNPFDAQGGDTLTLEGINFGANPGANGSILITIGGNDCPNALWSRPSPTAAPILTCTAPASVANADLNVSLVVSGNRERSSVSVATTCGPGYFKSSNNQCQICPVGAYCLGGDHYPRSMPGWWRTCTTDPAGVDCIGRGFVFNKCHPAVGCTGNNTCAAGYSGEMCNTCNAGYHRSTATRECMSCNGSVFSAFNFSGMILGFILVFVVVYYLTKWDYKVTALSICFDFCQMVAIIGTIELNWPTAAKYLFEWAELLNLDVSLGKPECVVGHTYWNFPIKMIVTQLTPVITYVAFYSFYATYRGFGALYALCKRVADDGDEEKKISSAIELGPQHLDIKHDDGTLLSEEDIKKRFPGMSEAQIREELKGFGKQMRDRTWDIIFGCWNLLFFYQYQTTVRVAVSWRGQKRGSAQGVGIWEERRGLRKRGFAGKTQAWAVLYITDIAKHRKIGR